MFVLKCKNNGSRVVDIVVQPMMVVGSVEEENEERGYCFTTFERLEKAAIVVIKRNGNRGI